MDDPLKNFCVLLWQLSMFLFAGKNRRKEIVCVRRNVNKSGVKISGKKYWEFDPNLKNIVTHTQNIRSCSRVMQQTREERRFVYNDQYQTGSCILSKNSEYNKKETKRSKKYLRRKQSIYSCWKSIKRSTTLFKILAKIKDVLKLELLHNINNFCLLEVNIKILINGTIDVTWELSVKLSSTVVSFRRGKNMKNGNK